MSSDDKDLSVREATLLALGSSQTGLKEIKDIFSTAATLFDAGDDRKGLLLIATEAVPRIKAFFGFCKSIVESNSDIFDKELTEKMLTLFSRSDAVMKTLFKETEAKNYTEVGDLLRFDFSDLLSEYAAIIPKISECFRRSTKASLETH